MSNHPSYSSSSYGTWAVDTGDGDQVCAGVTKAKAQEIARKRRRAGDKGATAYDTSRSAERYNPRRRRRKNPMGDTWVVTHANPATKPRANTRRYYVVLRNDKTGVDTYMILRPESHKDATTIMGKLVPIPTNRKHQRYMLVESSAATDRYAATGEGPRANPKRGNRGKRRNPARFIVMTASAPKIGKYGNYRRVAVVELDGSGVHPAMISERAKGIKRIVETWERVNYGGPKSAYAVALREAEALAAQLNAGA